MGEVVVTVLVEIAVRRGRVDAFVEAVRVNAAERAAAPGCLRLDVYQSATDPTLFTLIETFASQAAIDAYYASAAHAHWVSAVRSMTEEMRGSDQRVLFARPAVGGAP